MGKETIPENVRMAARRGFVRTTAQAYATSLGTGISATAIIAWLESTPQWWAFAITAAVTIVAPLLAGAASYLDIISKGIPEEYQEPEKPENPGVPAAE